MRYLAFLDDRMECIAAMPLSGRDRSDVRPGYRSKLAGPHIIFYRLLDGHVEVARILHQQMDFDQHL